MPMTWALCSLTAAINLSASTSTPRSTTLKPLLSSIMATRFLPISCRSPATVPIITLPAVGISAPPSFSFASSTPAFIAWADIIISGTNISPSLKRSPTSLIPGINPSLMTFMASSPASSSCCVAASTFSMSPLITRSASSFKLATQIPPFCLIN